MKSVLLLRCDKAGDALKTLPALRAAMAHFPNTRFSILCSKHNASLFAYERSLRVFQLPFGWESLEREELLKVLVSMPFAGTFDKTINLLCDPFPEVETLLELIPSDHRYSISRGLKLLKSSPEGTPEEMNIAFLLGQALQDDLISEVESQTRAPSLSSLDQEEALRNLGPKFQRRFAICPLAGTNQRSHSLRRWRRFIRLVARRAQPAEIYLLGSKSEREDLEFLKANNAQIEILYPSSFRSLTAYLEKMDGVIAVDSGPLHLAQAIGVPSLGILSGGDFRRWFSKLHTDDRILPRGWFSRYPSVLEMSWAFRKWCR